MCKLILVTLCVLTAITSAQAAEVSTKPSLTLGGTIIFVNGDIVPGDERQFRAVAESVSSDVPVVLRSRGGNVLAAMAIGRTIKARGLTTFVGRADYCESACGLIWLAGRHAVVQRNSALGFHATALNGQPSPQGDTLVDYYLREIGMSRSEIAYILGTPQPSIQWATEADAAALGIHPQVVPSSLGAWRGCRADYCLAIP